MSVKLNKSIKLLLASLLLFSFSQAVADTKDYPFSIESLQVGNGHQIVAHNKGPASISVVVSIVESQNLSSKEHWPVVTVVPPYSDQTIGVVSPNNPAVGYSFRTSVAYRFGVIGARHDANQLYRMPYLDGRTFTISQAPGGPITTHNTPDSQYAVDITMPEGTIILAARDGVVIDVEDSHTEGGKDPRLLTQANDIRILHSDGTIATYAHLMPHGVDVSVGQEIKAGQIIGYSGSTGYSNGPHLHFAVTRVVEYNGELSEVSIPITFYVGKPIVAFQPQAGLRVTANYISAIDPLRLDQSEVASHPETLQPIPVSQNEIPENEDVSIHLITSNLKAFISSNWSWLLWLFLLFILLSIWNSIERRKRHQEELIQEMRKSWRD